MKENGQAYSFEHGLSPVTSKIVDLLKVGKQGDILTDEKMTEHCGRETKVIGNGYGNLQTAIGRTERFHGLVWRRISGEVWIKCLDDEEKSSTGKSGLGKISRESRRTKRVLSLVEIDHLLVEKRSGHLVSCVQIGTISLMSKPATTKKLLARGVTKSPELDNLLQSFEKIA